ncbi:hypothetical protein [Roseiconus lacunae]|uniref:Uncharacterized protein n=1 Tax=Roseiconus lacunae TaxID=2605694 RepID=A0ABT7PH86_9BACT|nr:hypothetical protein [Roseiconus lacunae]MDM4015860.1 hypothetical protein [Roseiconus lacunae]
MSQTRIEITAEAAQAEATYERLTRAQDEQEAGQRSLETTANQVSAKVVDGYQQMLDAAGLVVDANGKLVDSAGNYATAAQAAAVRAAAGFEESATQIEAANEAAASKSAYAYNQILRELRRQGPEGRAQAKAVEEYLREAGLAGRRSMESITEELQELDPAAAAAAVAIKTDMGSAAEQSATKLQGIARELEKLGPEGKAQADAIRGYLRRTGQDGVRSMDDISDEISKIDPEAARVAKKAGDDFERAGDKAQSAFGADMRSQLLQMAGAYISLNAAAQVYQDTIVRARDAAKESVETLLDTVQGNRKLLQLTDDPERFAELSGDADRLAMTYGISRPQSRDLIFQAESAGFYDSIDTIAANSPVIDIGAQAIAAGKVPKLFKAAGQDLSPEEAIDAVLNAAENSIFEFEDLVTGLPSAAASLAPTNANFDETLSSLSVLGGAFKSVEVAGDRLAALGSALNLDTSIQLGPDANRTPLADQGLLPAIRVLRDQYSDEQRADFLGKNKELNEAYAVIVANFDEIEAKTNALAEVRALSGTDASETGRRRRVLESNSSFLAARNLINSRNQEEIEAEKSQAEAEAARQAAISTSAAQGMARGENAISIAAGKTARDWQQWIGDISSGVGGIAATPMESLASDAGFGRRRDSFTADERAIFRAIQGGATALQARMLDASPGDSPTLSSREVSEFFAGVGIQIDDSAITPTLRRTVTDRFRSTAGSYGSEAAVGNFSELFGMLLPDSLNANLGRQRNILEAFQADTFSLPPGVNAVQSRPIERRTGRIPSSNADLAATLLPSDQPADLGIKLDENNRLQREILEEVRKTSTATRDTADASNKTARNTEKDPPDYTAEIDNELDRRIPDPI